MAQRKMSRDKRNIAWIERHCHIPEGKNVIRYESPEVFETLTKEWCAAKSQRRGRARTQAAL